MWSYVQSQPVPNTVFWKRVLGSDVPKYDFKSIPDQYAKERFSNNIPDPSSARLLNPIWNGGVEDEFNLEYMDLDEFLIETGLVETNFADIIPPSGLLQQANLQSKKPVESPQPIGLGQLLSQNGISSPSSANTLSPRSSTQSQNTDDEDEPLQTEKHDPQIVKKRKYKEDGQGLTETSVVVVPGQDGFDPASSKFKPEELKPQPIIKKSKKQYVPEESKDEKYWRRRNKNNVAAKRSREARRAKENQIIMRAGFLESENEKLTEENSRLIKENEELKALVERLKSKC